MLPSNVAAIELGTMSWIALAVAAFCELGLPDALERGAQTAAELAAQGYGEESRLYRLLRALAAYEVVRYVGADRFGLGHVGEGLVGARSAASMVRYANASWHVDAYAHLAQAITAQRSGFELSHGVPLFEFFAGHPREGAMFDDGMRSLAPLHVPQFAAAYDFSLLAHVVDVGGGTGAMLTAILRRFPHVRGTVFELPAVARQARERALPPELRDRLDVVEGNISQDAPPAAEAYVLSHVLHDWDDETCARMLRNVRRSMPSGARVLVYEIVAAPPNNAWSQDRITDIEMLAMLSGRERSREEFAALFQRSGLRLRRVIATSAPESILEAVAVSTPPD